MSAELKARLAMYTETLRWIADEGLSCGDYAACVREAQGVLRTAENYCPHCDSLLTDPCDAEAAETCPNRAADRETAP
jgi:nitrite reductase/ring-hydroxylating ferredoxin subunit